MSRAPLPICLLVVAVISSLLLPALAEEPATAATPRSASDTAVPVVPDKMAGVAQGNQAPDALRLERQELDRIESEFAPRIRELQTLARQTKGPELAEIQKRIGALKREQEKKGLDARIEAARRTGDERRLQQLLKVQEESTEPRPGPEAPVEMRPVPVQKREGGAR